MKMIRSKFPLEKRVSQDATSCYSVIILLFEQSSQKIIKLDVLFWPLRFIDKLRQDMMSIFRCFIVAVSSLLLQICVFQAICHLISYHCNMMDIFQKIRKFIILACETDSDLANSHTASYLDRVDLAMNSVVFMQNNSAFNDLLQITSNLPYRQLFIRQN